MDPTIVLTISELVKAGLQFYASYMRQQGLTEEQIQKAFDDARIELMLNDPNKL